MPLGGRGGIRVLAFQWHCGSAAASRVKHKQKGQHGSDAGCPSAALRREELGGSLRARRAARRDPAVHLRLQERHAAPWVSRKANAPGKTALKLPSPKRLTGYSQQLAHLFD